MISKFERFLTNREARYCSAKTLRYYRQAWDVWGKWLPERAEDITEDTIDDIVALIRKVRKVQKPNEELSPISVKGYLRALNVFLKWLKVTHRVDLASVKTPKTVLKLFSPEQVRMILHASPQSVREHRVALALAIVADTGLRADEVLNLRCSDIEIGDLLLTVQKGKGQKGREVPISSALRRKLKDVVQSNDSWLFQTHTGRPWSYRNSLRDLKLFCKRLEVSGPRISWHTVRHSFATNYIRQGGSVTMLQRVLGHTTLAMTQRYVHLQTEDLQRVHDRLTMVK